MEIKKEERLNEEDDDSIDLTNIPHNIVKPATIFPPTVTGNASPYPTVVIVTIHHQKVPGIDWKGLI